MFFVKHRRYTSTESNLEDLPLNIVVVFEDPATKQRKEGSPYKFASTLDVPCPCGNLIHPITGAWCPRCGAKVVEVRMEPARAIQAHINPVESCRG